MTTLTHYLQGLSQRDGDCADSELLERFLAETDQDAFAHLVHRHGPMVLGVCRRLLQHNEDAEDAFQATFLVLARKASSIRPREKLAGWLYSVAYRTACKRRANRGRTWQRERQVADLPELATQDSTSRDLQPLLDQELRGLPEKYRTVLILCDLEGRNQHSVAEMLGSPEGTISSRLCRARKLLADRLTRRGLTLNASALATLLTQQGATASMPLVRGTTQGVIALQTGENLTPAQLSTKTIPLANEVIQAMNKESLSRWLIVILTLGFTLVGGVMVVQRIATADPVKASAVRAEPDVEPVPEPKEDWGHVKGRFVLEGKIPEPEKVKYNHRGAFPGLDLVDESLIVGKDRGIKNITFMLIKAPEKVHPRLKKKDKSVMKLEKGQFTPHIVLTRTGQPLEIQNPSQVPFNAHGQPKVNNPFNVLIVKEAKYRWTPEKVEQLPIPITCNIYPWMRCYVWVSDHPYVVVTGTDGRFELRDLPAGTWTFSAWHERFGYLSPKGTFARSFTLTIKPGEQIDLGTIPIKLKDK